MSFFLKDYIIVRLVVALRIVIPHGFLPTAVWYFELEMVKFSLVFPNCNYLVGQKKKS